MISTRRFCGSRTPSAVGTKGWVSPSVTRIVLVRVPAEGERLRSAAAYLPTQGSITEDLATLGLRVEDPAVTDQLLAQFLTGTDGGFDQIPVSAYRALADTFDRSWLAATR